MELNFIFFFNSVLLGVGLAMDAFSVSLADGLHETNMKPRKMSIIAGMFALFQALMPLIGWFFVHTIVQYFQAFEKFIPWIALGLLGYIGVQMILEAREEGDEEHKKPDLGWSALIVQAIATSIDALSVGFTIAEYGFFEALLAAVIIAIVTFFICMFGLEIGKRAGTKLAGKANFLGGVILIFIGLEIFIGSFF
jgi:putative Mn2+ efflux pump MntP